MRWNVVSFGVWVLSGVRKRMESGVFWRSVELGDGVFGCGCGVVAGGWRSNERCMVSFGVVFEWRSLELGNGVFWRSVE